MTRLELKPHQQETVAFWHRVKGRGLDASDPGLGKTLGCIKYLDEADLWPALVVCPASVKGHWAKEVKQWAGKKALQIEGQTLCEGEIKEPLSVINYNILWHQLPWLLEQQFKVMVFDECHSLQSPDTQWTKAAMQLARTCPRVQGLSGTPIANRTKDFFPILHMIRPDLFPSFHDYAWKYCDPRFVEIGGRWDYNGASNLDKLHQEIKPFTIRHRKAILGLPKQSIHLETVPLDNEEHYRPLHDQYVKTAKRSWFGLFEKKQTDKLTLTTKLLMTVARGKARGVVMWIRAKLATDPKMKMIVFCTHTGMLDVIYRRAVEQGEAVFIDGSVTAKKRTKIIEQFQTDPSIRLIVCNIVAAGAGITLTAATETVFAELPWSPRHVLQAKDRNFRIGTSEETRVTYLITAGTIEEKLCKILQEKQLIAEQAIDGTRTERQVNTLDLLMLAMKDG